MPRTKTPKRSPRRGAIHQAAAPDVGRAPNSTLVAALADRLRQPLDLPDLPLITVNRITPTRSAHVLVIWDKWKDLKIPERGRVITDAFAAAFPADNWVVSLPMGLTPGEALTQGYLRCLIIPYVSASDHVTAKQIRDAMASAGGVMMRVGNDKRLGFATRAQAETAYRRLLEKINKPIWVLVGEGSSTELAQEIGEIS